MKKPYMRTIIGSSERDCFNYLVSNFMAQGWAF